jgi:hypothetical protein
MPMVSSIQHAAMTSSKHDASPTPAAHHVPRSGAQRSGRARLPASGHQKSFFGIVMSPTAYEEISYGSNMMAEVPFNGIG